MLTEHRADELKRKSKNELIALLLEAERQRDVAQHDLDMFRSREPGRYAFWHRHLALAYVRKRDADLHREASNAACEQIDAQGGKSYKDVVAGLEAACEAAISRIESLSEWMQCECAPCRECGKTPKECTDTPCAETCTCSECDRCQADGTLTFIRAALDKAGVDRA